MREGAPQSQPKARCNPDHHHDHTTLLTTTTTQVLAASGTLAAITSTAASMPVDVVKTRLQCSAAPMSALQVVRGVMRETGGRGLWSGFIPRLVAAVPKSIITVLAYERAIALCRT